MMGLPSPYLMVAFPNRPPMDQDAFTFRGWPRRKIEAWKRAFLGYLKALTFKDPRRLVLKSPTHQLHTCNSSLRTWSRRWFPRGRAISRA